MKDYSSHIHKISLYQLGRKIKAEQQNRPKHPCPWATMDPLSLAGE
jgi:hypothetical protein